MTKLDAKNMPAKELCARIRESTDTALAVEHVNGQRYWAGTDLLISCVDSRSARVALHRIAWRDTSRYRYWLDLGNTEAMAQVVLGQPEGGRDWTRGQRGRGCRA